MIALLYLFIFNYLWSMTGFTYLIANFIYFKYFVICVQTTIMVLFCDCCIISDFSHFLVNS